MKRLRFLSAFYVVFDSIRSILVVFSRQKMGPLAFLAILIFFLALFFGFLAFMPLLSPFVYPLF